MQEAIRNLVVNGVTRAESVMELSDIEPGFVDRIADTLAALSDQSADLRAEIALEQAARKFRGLAKVLSTIGDRLKREYDDGYADGRADGEDWG